MLFDDSLVIFCTRTAILGPKSFASHEVKDWYASRQCRKRIVRSFAEGHKCAKTTSDRTCMAVATPAKILIVDDDRVDREIYKRYLADVQPPGYEFAEADSGRAAMEAFRLWRPDAILLDYNLPDMNGLYLL